MPRTTFKAKMNKMYREMDDDKESIAAGIPLRRWCMIDAKGKPYPGSIGFSSAQNVWKWFMRLNYSRDSKINRTHAREHGFKAKRNPLKPWETYKIIELEAIKQSHAAVEQLYEDVGVRIRPISHMRQGYLLSIIADLQAKLEEFQRQHHPKEELS